MAGRKFVVAWRHGAEELRGRYRSERDRQLARRWQALWLLREGRALAEVAALVGVAYRTVQEWVGWYRAGGLDEVARHRVGGLRRPIRRPLTPEQEAALVERAGTVGFATRQLALDWLAERFGARLTLRQLERVFTRRRLRRKVPRPISDRADPAAQATWKGGGLAAALSAAGVRLGQAVAWADEMRLGLHGQVRRRWTPRGVKLRLKVEVRYVWRYLALAVDPAGRLHWRWLERFRKEPVAEVVRAWQADGVRALVWDGAPSHAAKLVRDIGLPLVRLPAYAPELNPAERVFEELRRAVEGEIYGDIDAKVAAVEAVLAPLAADPARVRQLVGWGWITQALAQLPP